MNILIYKRKSNGPSTDPCGTPLDIRAASDNCLFISWVCDLLHKKDSNQLLIIPRKP